MADRPLAGTRVLELGGVGPGPHAAMILADLGADVVRIVRPTSPASDESPAGWAPRGCRELALDLKEQQERERFLDLAQCADVLIEGFRPGVVERLGIGPDECLGRNQRLLYGRISGWGQSGPYAPRAGHDINYLAVSGLLNAIGQADGRPVPPLSLVGDFGGGSMLLLVGLLVGMVDRARSGHGQVIDAAMLDGSLLLGDLFLAQHSAGSWSERRGDNLLDGGAPFYGSSDTSVGA